MTFEKNLSVLSQRLRMRGIREGMPKGLSTRLQEGMPFEGLRRSARPPRLTPQTAGAAIFISIVTVGITVRFCMTHAWSRIRPPSGIQPGIKTIDDTEILRDKVRAAANSALTFHLQSRTILSNPDQSRQPAITQPGIETWGQRNPFFYRDDLGHEVFVDDGRKSYHLIPGRIVAPNKEHGNSGFIRPSILIVRPSAHEFPYVDELGSLLVGNTQKPAPSDDPNIGASSMGTVSSPGPRIVTSSDGTEAIESILNSVDSAAPSKSVSIRSDLSFDSRTFLPKKYTISTYSGTKTADHSQDDPLTGGRRATLFETLATYNHPIPAGLTTPPETPGAIVIEIRQAHDGGSHGTGKVEIVGLDAVAMPVRIPNGSGGNDALTEAAYRLEWRMNGKPIDPDLFGGTIPLSIQGLTISDSAGRRYLAISNHDLGNNNCLPDVVFPIEPVPAIDLTTQHLTAKFEIIVSGSDRGGKIGYIGPDYTIPITSTFRVAPYRRDDVTSVTQDDARDCLQSFAEARSTYYMPPIGRSGFELSPASRSIGTPANQNASMFMLRVAPPPVDVPMSQFRYSRAVYWSNVVIGYAERGGKKGVANYYRSRIESLGPPP